GPLARVCPPKAPGRAGPGRATVAVRPAAPGGSGASAGTRQRSNEEAAVSGITVGIDGSAHSAEALDWAARGAAIRQTPLTVLIVDSVPASPWTGNPIATEPDQLDSARQAAEEMTAKVISQLGTARPPSVHLRAVTGFPVKELISASEEADLVV